MEAEIPPRPAPAGQRAPSVPRRPVLRRLAGLVLGLALGLVLAELAVRVRVGSPLVERTPLLVVRANPHRGWEMLPGEPHYTYLHRVEINSLGLRGPEVPATKAPDEVRVMALGDSLVYGQGVADGDTLPARLEAELGARAGGRSWRVINAGLRGYATNQELGLLRELGPRLEPDIVLLLWYWNDLDPVDIERLNARFEASGPVTFDIGAPFEGRAALRWHGKQLLRRSALLMFAHELRKTGYGPRTPDFLRSGYTRLAAQLEELRTLCDELGAAPVFAIIPDIGGLVGNHWTLAVDERAAAIAEEAGLPVVRLGTALEPLVTSSPRPPILPYDGHYTPEANQVMAEALVDAVLDASP